MNKRFNIIDFIKGHIKRYGELTIFNSDIETYYYMVLGVDKYIYDYQMEKVVRQIYNIAENMGKYSKHFTNKEINILTWL